MSAQDGIHGYDLEDQPTASFVVCLSKLTTSIEPVNLETQEIFFPCREFADIRIQISRWRNVGRTRSP